MYIQTFTLDSSLKGGFLVQRVIKYEMDLFNLRRKLMKILLGSTSSCQRPKRPKGLLKQHRLGILEQKKESIEVFLHSSYSTCNNNVVAMIITRVILLTRTYV